MSYIISWIEDLVNIFPQKRGKKIVFFLDKAIFSCYNDKNSIKNICGRGGMVDAPVLGTGGIPCRFKSCRPHQKKTLSKDKVFFNEINPCGICEMHFVREIRLRRVKCLRA